jgi:hypothetical protein
MRKKMYFGSIPLVLCALVFTITTAPSCQSSGSQNGKADQQKDDDGFVQMFDGKTLNNWEGDTTYWHATGGVLVGEETAETAPLLKANTFLIWKGGQPSDFELKAEYRISKGGNSGIQYRSEKVAGLPYALRGYQLDMDGTNHYTGQNYEERGRDIIAFRGQKVTLPPVTEPIGSLAKKNVWTASVVTGSLGSADSLKSLIKDGWNTCRIVAKGNHLQHYINGVLMSDVTDNDTANRKSSGLIGLQLHAGLVMKIEIRNIRIKE